MTDPVEWRSSAIWGMEGTNVPDTNTVRTEEVSRFKKERLKVSTHGA